MKKIIWVLMFIFGFNVYSQGVSTDMGAFEFQDKTTVSVNANAGADQTICLGESVTLTASGGSSYSWNTGETTKSITVSPSTTTDYTVSVTEGSESDTDQVKVTVSSVIANAGSDKTITEGESITLTATGGNDYLWSNGATSETITVSPTTNTTYSVTATIGSCSDTDEVKVTVNPSTSGTPVAANAGADQTICLGESVTLTASGGSSYSWNTGETTKSITVSPSTTTDYTVSVTEGSESDTDQVKVTVSSVIANAGSDKTITEGESITLTATGGNDYLWSNGATSETITVSPTTNTTYSVTATIGSCSDTDEVKVTVNPSTSGTPVAANAGADQTICLGESVTLTASGGSSYSWNTGETTKSITVSPSTTTDYTVSVTEGSESDTDQVKVTVSSVIANAGSDKTITEGESITLTATGGNDYLWSNGATSETITVSPTTNTTYSVTATIGSCSDTDEVKVTVQQLVDSNIPSTLVDAGEDMTICLGQSVTLNGSGGDSYVWSTGETTSRLSVSPTRTTTYTLEATIEGITKTDTVTVTVENCDSGVYEDEQDLAIMEMNLYPNPTYGELNIMITNLDQDSNIIINDTKGGIIYSEFLNDQTVSLNRNIDISRYGTGIYFVRLWNQQQTLIKKVILQ